MDKETRKQNQITVLFTPEESQRIDELLETLMRKIPGFSRSRSSAVRYLVSLGFTEHERREAKGNA